jgi:hypothetical protein
MAILSLSSAAWGAENQSAASTSLGSSARYEIVQSELSAKNTFRLDKFCGSVAQLVKDKDDQISWQSMPIEPKLPCAADNRNHYQLFTSGLAVKFTFLMNTDNGTTWQLVVDSNQDISWQMLR